MFRYVNVNFGVSSDFNLQSLNGKDYVFKNDIEDLAEGDIVVCETAMGYGVGKVLGEELHSTRIKLANAWVVEKVNIQRHTDRLAKEKQIVKLMADMESRRQKLQDEAIYQLLAKEDTEMANLLSQLAALRA